MPNLRLIPAALFVSIALTLTAQDVTRVQADSLAATLNKQIPDSDRMKALLSLATVTIHQRHINDTILNTANAYISQAEELNKKIHFPYFAEQMTLYKASLYKAQGNREEGKKVLVQLIDRLKAGNNKVLLGRAYYDLSEYFTGNFLQQTMEERIKYLKFAIAAYSETDHYVDLARCYRFLADLHQLTNDNPDAFVEVRTALKYYKLGGYTEVQGATALLGRLYFEGGDYKQALDHELLALKIATNSKDDNIRLICQINNNIGFTYTKLKEYSKALSYFMQALKIADQEKDNETVYLLAANVADTWLGMNKPEEAARFFQQIIRKYVMPADRKYESSDFGISQTYLKIFLAMKQYDRAKVYCDNLIHQTINPNINLYPLSNYYQLIARYYIETGNFDNARLYLKKDKDLVDSLKYLSGLAENYTLKFSLDTASRNYKEAINDLVLANAVKDSIFDATKSQQIAQLEVEFDTEKKVSEIDILNQKAALESVRLKEADFVKNVTVIGIVLLAIIAALLYRQSRFRKQSNIIVTGKNKQLQNLLIEKEWLLKEVHHRVKNNLHTVICLLESQARYLSEDALRAIESSQNRIYAMSLIHQKLYQSDDIGTIEIDNYLRELTNYLSDSFGSPAMISIQLELEKVRLNLSQAIPLGLIINEAVTNAFKYAFPNKRSGKITIRLSQEEHMIRLLIADNGVGMRHGSASLSKSLGLDLMRGLTQELQGEIQFDNDNGTKIKMSFPVESLNAMAEAEVNEDAQPYQTINALNL